MGVNYSVPVLIIAAVFWVAECIAFPIFIKAQWPKKCVKSFCWKMISASLFVGYGVFAFFAAKNAWGNRFFETFARDMVIGLCFGWLGDLLLHLTALSKNPGKVFTGAAFVSGLIAFLVGHIFYVIAYIEGKSKNQEIHLVGGKTITIRSSMKVFESQLAEAGFIRIHQGYFIDSRLIQQHKSLN